MKSFNLIVFSSILIIVQSLTVMVKGSAKPRPNVQSDCSAKKWPCISSHPTGNSRPAFGYPVDQTFCVTVKGDDLCELQIEDGQSQLSCPSGSVNYFISNKIPRLDGDPSKFFDFHWSDNSQGLTPASGKPETLYVACK